MSMSLKFRFQHHHCIYFDKIVLLKSTSYLSYLRQITGWLELAAKGVEEGRGRGEGGRLDPGVSRGKCVYKYEHNCQA